MQVQTLELDGHQWFTQMKYRQVHVEYCPKFAPFITSNENGQINYILQLIQPILKNEILSIEVDNVATDAYNDKIHDRLEKTQYTECASWYRVGQKGKITNIFPG